MPNGSYARELKEMPDHSNSNTRHTENRMGLFEYQKGVEEITNLQDKGPHEMDNGAIYYGQWTKDGRRAGKGI